MNEASRCPWPRLGGAMGAPTSDVQMENRVPGADLGEELAAGTRARELDGAQTLLGKSPEFRLPPTHRCPTGHPRGKAFLYICLPSGALPGGLCSPCLLGLGGSWTPTGEAADEPAPWKPSRSLSTRSPRPESCHLSPGARLSLNFKFPPFESVGLLPGESQAIPEGRGAWGLLFYRS